MKRIELFVFAWLTTSWLELYDLLIQIVLPSKSISAFSNARASPVRQPESTRNSISSLCPSTVIASRTALYSSCSRYLSWMDSRCGAHLNGFNLSRKEISCIYPFLYPQRTTLFNTFNRPFLRSALSPVLFSFSRMWAFGSCLIKTSFPMISARVRTEIESLRTVAGSREAIF